MNGEGFPLVQYAWVVAGIVISLALPLLRKLLPPVKQWVWYTSLLAGYAWDSTLQKIAGT